MYLILLYRTIVFVNISITVSYTKADYDQTQGLMIVWMACYHDTNSMNEEHEEKTYAHFMSAFFHLKDRF